MALSAVDREMDTAMLLTCALLTPRRNVRAEPPWSEPQNLRWISVQARVPLLAPGRAGRFVAVGEDLESPRRASHGSPRRSRARAERTADHVTHALRAYMRVPPPQPGRAPLLMATSGRFAIWELRPWNILNFASQSPPLSHLSGHRFAIISSSTALILVPRKAKFVCCGVVVNSQATLLYNTSLAFCNSENTATHGDHKRSMLSHVTLPVGILISMEMGHEMSAMSPGVDILGRACRRMLPISNIEFLSICDPDIERSVIRGKLFQYMLHETHSD
ncbi:hypothetical protein BC826DRAFT_1061737 [Russula brevipes]|nr:hypothetical protein BC826DRAFT_1061737 [Russula brevipes]